jgi:hypothetical protein
MLLVAVRSGHPATEQLQLPRIHRRPLQQNSVDTRRWGKRRILRSFVIRF